MLYFLDTLFQLSRLLQKQLNQGGRWGVDGLDYSVLCLNLELSYATLTFVECSEKAN